MGFNDDFYDKRRSKDQRRHSKRTKMAGKIARKFVDRAKILLGIDLSQSKAQKYAWKLLGEYEGGRKVKLSDIDEELNNYSQKNLF